MHGNDDIDPMHSYNGSNGAQRNGHSPRSVRSPVVEHFSLPTDFLVYYDQARKLFWAKNSLDEWMQYAEAQLSRRLRAVGVDKTRFTETGLHLVEAAMDQIMQERSVHYAGEMAGYPVGTYEILGHRVLITRGPRIPKPAKRAFPTIETFLSSLLDAERKYFDAWIKCALLALKAGSPFRPGQVLGIAGPPGCGKSLLQDLITEILGGRSAKPYRYLTGDTSFNSDLFRAEHLCIEDEPASVDARTRRHFAAAIKGLCVNRVQSFHPKGKDSMSMTPFWRLSISVNDDQDHLMVLPPLDDSLLDKIILLRANQATFPFTSEDLAGRKRFRDTLTAELPGYLFWLRAWRMPASLQDQRFGCVAYQNAELKQMLLDLDPEHKLWTLIRALKVIPLGLVGWTGEAGTLDVLLREKDRSGDVARILYYNTACGVYLDRLSRIYPENIKRVKGGAHKNRWQIIVPDEEPF